jgi:RNA polymerase sigma factor (TIGR02999 family)
MSAPTSSHQVSELLVRWRGGDNEALGSLIPLVYAELRKLARGYLRRQRPDHTLQSAALVHEAYVRLAGKSSLDLQNRSHFFAVAARLMRDVLVEHARSRGAAKRGAGVANISLDEALGIPQQKNVDVLLLDEALTRLAQLDERQCRVVELRFFAGLSIEETSEALAISVASVSRDWTTARLWLRREITRMGAA